MPFIANKYTLWYNNIINRAKERDLPADTYTEKHHIIPRSLGGNNRKDNLVHLTAREHFVAHWLLTKMTVGVEQKKMAYACKMMMHSHSSKQGRHKITSRKYKALRENLNTILKGRIFTKEWRDKLSSSARNRAKNESDDAKQIRRDAMIKANKSRKGEKRDYMTGANNYFYNKKFVGKDNGFYGKSHTEETLKMLQVPKPKFVCPHCGATVGGKSNYDRWHNNNCKVLKGDLLCRG